MPAVAKPLLMDGHNVFDARRGVVWEEFAIACSRIVAALRTIADAGDLPMTVVVGHRLPW